MLMARRDVGDCCRNTIRQLDDLNLITCQPRLRLEGRALDLDEGRLPGFGDSFVAVEEIGGAYGGKDVVEIVSEYPATVHADHSLGVAVEEDEFEVADLAGVVVDAVVEDDGIGAGFCGRDEAEFVVPRARRVSNDESEAAYGDGEAGDEDC